MDLCSRPGRSAGLYHVHSRLQRPIHCTSCAQPCKQNRNGSSTHSHPPKQEMGSEPSVEVELGEAGRNWERPAPPPWNPRTQALGELTKKSQTCKTGGLCWRRPAFHSSLHARLCQARLCQPRHRLHRCLVCGRRWLLCFNAKVPNQVRQLSAMARVVKMADD